MVGNASLHSTRGLMGHMDMDEEQVLHKVCRPPAAARPADPEDVGRIQALVAALPHQEGEVLRLLFGLDGGEPLATEAVARHLGLSGQVVGRLRTRALARLRERSMIAAN
jgi:DNA-directed RNA polymerase sigma subunit (sigma70/sigma32)